MAFFMTESEREEYFSGMLIPAVEAYNVSGAFVTTKTGVNAKVLTVPGIGEPSVRDYDGTDMALDDIGDASVDVTLDQKKYVNASIERVDDFNSFLEAVPETADRSSAAVAKVIDVYLFGKLAETTNSIPTVSVTDVNILGLIGDLGVKLDNLEAPQAGRRLALTPEIVAILTEVLGTTSGSDSIATEAGRTGFVTSYGGFSIYKTVNLLAGAVTTYDALNLTDIPKTAPVVVNQAVTGVTSGTAVLGDGTVIGVQTVDGTLYTNDATDTGIAAAAAALIDAQGKEIIAAVDSGTALGIGYNEARVVELEKRFADAVQSLVCYGAKVVKNEFVVKCDVTLG